MSFRFLSFPFISCQYLSFPFMSSHFPCMGMSIDLGMGTGIGKGMSIGTTTSWTARANRRKVSYSPGRPVMHAYACMRACICVCMHMHAYAYACMHARICIFMHAYACPDVVGNFRTLKCFLAL